MISNLLKKFPTTEQLMPVYAVIAVFVYAWSALQFFWRIPSWLKFSSWAEVFVMYSYVAVVNLLESLTIFFIVMLVFLLLPARLSSGQFIAKAFLFSVAALGLLAYRDYNVYPEKVFYEMPENQWVIFFTAAAVILMLPFHKVPAVTRALEAFADRFVIFLYITIPVSVVSLVVIIFRNLF